MSGSAELIEIIRDEIRAGGPISFARFMQLALYHPQHGYYAAGRARIGRSGDYFTNVSVGKTFGRLIAAQFLEMRDKLGAPDEFTIVEQGAHDGRFARDVLEYFHERDAATRYVIVEPFPVLQLQQRETLRGFEPEWRDSLEDLEPFSGVHFSNELFDALPVRLFVAPNQERFVDSAGATFRFIEREANDIDLPQLDAGYAVEICDEAPRLIAQIAAKLDHGYVLAIDYGFTREDRFAPHRREGTLQVRAAHQLLASPFEKVGEADITAHVDWTAIAVAAATHGLDVAGFCDQHHFLTGLLPLTTALSGRHIYDGASARELKTLLHPEMLGRSFQALVLTKNAGPPLSGLRYARAADVAALTAQT